METIDSTSGNEPATSRRVTRPKEYDEQLAFLVESGTKARIERARGDLSKADFLRSAVDDAIKAALRRSARREKP